MCTGGGGGGDAAAEARRREEERQARIKAGMSQIDAIFEGGAYGAGERIDEFEGLQPGQTYYRADGSAYVVPSRPEPPQPGQQRPPRPTGTEADYAYNTGAAQGQGESPFATPSQPASPTNTELQAWRDQVEDQFGEGLYTAREETEGFGDDFYDERSGAYLDYATPQLEDQYKSASAALTAALSRSGNLRSTLAATRGRDLAKSYGTQRQNIADKGRGYADEARRGVANARSDAVQLLNASGDPDMAVSEALNRVNLVQDSMPTFDPLAPVFQNATSGLAGYMQGQRYGDIRDNVNTMYNTNPGTGSGRVVR